MAHRPRNRRPDLNGALVIDKPIGMTSFGVVRAVRRISGGAKVGHAGTLDPLASGVLILCLGKATRAIDSLMAAEKEYRAQVDLSAFTETDDREGEPIPVPVAAPPSREAIEHALTALTGTISQSPPLFSAVHVQGQRAYKLARRGELHQRPDPRPVVVHEISLIDYDWPLATLDIRCGKGVYIRSLARDLGAAMGTGGHLASLRRTRIGRFTLDDATPLDEVPQPLTPEHLIQFEE